MIYEFNFTMRGYQNDELTGCSLPFCNIIFYLHASTILWNMSVMQVMRLFGHDS